MRQSQNKPLSIEEHRHLGTELRKARVRMHELCRLVVELYGSNNPAAFSFLRAAESIDRLCGEMEAQAVRDWPGQHIGGIYS
jgi:hypothetical protein